MCVWGRQTNRDREGGLEETGKWGGREMDADK